MLQMPLASAAAPNVEWPTYLGDAKRDLYSPLRQINRENVAGLEEAWSYDTGDLFAYQANNLVIDGILYTISPTQKVIAVNAANGRELWVWAPKPDERTGGAGPTHCRGLVHWQNDRKGEKRIFSVLGTRLYALDPKSGRVIQDFGENGSNHLGKGLDGMEEPNVLYTTPGVIYRDLLIFGVSSGTPRGIRAMDVRTGKIRWQFNTAPLPGEYGYETWPENYDRSNISVNAWAGQALDENRGIVYVATKTAQPDFYGGERHGQNLFANCIMALNARTGQRLWHFQIVHHDIVDRDLPCAPVLLTVRHGGRQVDVVAQGTKQGLLFVFDRVTGEPLWPIEERPVPKSDLEGEQSWPTQPFPTKPLPLMRQLYTEADASTISPDAHALTLDGIRLMPSAGPFPAPSLKTAVMFPGPNGGMEWGGGAADPDGIYYVNVSEVPWLLQMVETRKPDGTPLAPGERHYMVYCAACHGVDRSGILSVGFPSLIGIDKRRSRSEVEKIVLQGGGRMPPFDSIRVNVREAILDYLFRDASDTTHHRTESGSSSGGNSSRYAFAGFRYWKDREGYPAIKPPWGTLNAVDLNTGEIKWKVTLGEYPELTARGLPPTGTENYGGPVVTAGGLVFIAAAADKMIRAFDKDTGKMLWKARLPFSGNSTPSTYMVDGRQYVVISAGGSRWGGPVGGRVVAFTLPKGGLP
ncbi:MAG: PQQ-binding-like beta-propeller repeat protein [Verrucomicrobia bacterium]|nr:PQQ-binding-like beta-propeller repeat protein [Verrucomicrobiota bacterium]